MKTINVFREVLALAKTMMQDIMKLESSVMINRPRKELAWQRVAVPQRRVFGNYREQAKWRNQYDRKTKEGFGY